MKWPDVGKIIKHMVPALAAAVPGGGVAASLIANALGVAEEPEAVAKAVTEDPDAFLKLKALENSHKEVFERIGLERDAAEQRDRADARARDIEVRKLSQHNRRADTLAYLSVLLVALIGGSLVYFTFFSARQVEPAFIAILGTLLGGILGNMQAVYNFEFGSSKGSRDKDAFKGKDS